MGDDNLLPIKNEGMLDKERYRPEKKETTVWIESFKDALIQGYGKILERDFEQVDQGKMIQENGYKRPTLKRKAREL